MRRSIGASMTRGAVSASRRKPAMKVCFFQCPNGAFERNQRPLGQRPRGRVIFVVVPVSSIKTRRCGSSRISGWRVVVQSSRAWLTSGRSCSLARRVFFEAIAVANEPARQRSGIGPLAGRGGELGCQFRHGDVCLLGDKRQKKRPIRFELGAPPPPLGLASKLPLVRTAFIRFTTNETNTLKCAAAARMAVLDKADNTFTQI